MKSRHILVTGAARGIGLALAGHFVGQGWLVTGIDRNPSGVTTSGYSHAQVDITDEPAMVGAFEAASKIAPLDAVVANSALTDVDHRQAVDLDYAVWQRILQVNTGGAFLTARLAARHMMPQQRGNIIFITSSLAFLKHAKANDAPYCASKAAVEMLARVLAIELAADGINVNTLFPSVMIDTGFFAHLPTKQRAALARPDLLNEPAAFLAGLAPGSLTGQSIDQQRWADEPAYRRQLQGEPA